MATTTSPASGPIQPRLYKPDDKIGPPNWIHNLEHGALVVLYRNDSPGATAAGQQAFRDYFTSFPASPVCKLPGGQIAPVIARFDDMPHPYALLVWDRILYLDTWDPAVASKFFLAESERLDSTGVLNKVNPPEPQCAGPTPIPGREQPGSVRLRRRVRGSVGSAVSGAIGCSVGRSVGRGQPGAKLSRGAQCACLPFASTRGLRKKSES